MSVRPSVRTEQLGSHWTDFHDILFLTIFRKYVEKFFIKIGQEQQARYMKTSIHL